MPNISQNERTVITDAVLEHLRGLEPFRRRRLKDRLLPDRPGQQLDREALSALDGETLKALGRFLNVGDPQIAGWPKAGLRIFASHVAAARGRFGSLKDSFGRFGANLFFAHDDIEGGAPWRKSLLDALSTMDALVTIHSKGFAESVWCNQEVGFALARGIPIISLMDGEPPCGFISETQGIPMRPDSEQEIVGKALALILERDAKRYGEAMARVLKAATSYGHADMLADEVEECSASSPRALDDIELAVRFNDQVYESGNVDLLTAYAAAHGRQLWSPPARQHPTSDPVF